MPHREAPPAARRPGALRHLLLDDRPLPPRHHQPDRSSSAIGALAATLAAWGRGRLNWPMMEATIRQTLGISAMFLWIILAALCFSAVFDGSAPAGRSLASSRAGPQPWAILLMMQLLLHHHGMFLDDPRCWSSSPPLRAAGHRPRLRSVWCTVLYTITCQIAYVTPPFGYNLFLMRAMAPRRSTLPDICRSIVPFTLLMYPLPRARSSSSADRALAAAERRPSLTKNNRENDHDQPTLILEAGRPRRAGAVGASTLAAPYVKAQAPIEWRLPDLRAPRSRPTSSSPRSRHRQGGERRDGDRALYRDQLVPEGSSSARAAGHAGRGAVGRRLHGLAGRRRGLRRYFPFATLFSLDVPALFANYGLKEIWEEVLRRHRRDLARSGAWDPCNLGTTVPVKSLADLQGKRVYTFRPPAASSASSAWCR